MSGDTPGGAQVVVTMDSADQVLRDRCLELAARLGFPFAQNASPAQGLLILAVRTDGLELRDHESRPGRGLRADFSWLARPRGGRGGLNLSKNQPLAKAIGSKNNRVFDATAGLGQDAALLAAMGWCVAAIERSPVLAVLLEDGLRAARENPVIRELLADRLTFHHGDARELLRSFDPKPEVVYIDPMFPPKRKASALAKKSIRLVRQLVGDDPDAAQLLAVAREHALERVVVKRPDHAQPLADDVTMSYGGKLVRYDVYKQKTS
jgi:16S rRNA (guanine1516-N2)-methyltransferase